MWQGSAELHDLLMPDTSRKIRLILCAEGTSSLYDWHPNGILFRNNVLQTKLILENSILIEILWHQGESDSMVALSNSYYTKLSKIISALRDEHSCLEQLQKQSLNVNELFYLETVQFA